MSRSPGVRPIASRRSSPDDHPRQRRAILRIAERHFAAFGFRGTSIRELAAQSRCSVGHLYNLYGDKLGIYQAVVEQRVLEMGELLRADLARDASVWDRLEILLARTARFFEEHSAFFRIYLIETGGGTRSSSRPVVARVLRWQAEFHRLVLDLLEDGKRRGEIMENGTAVVFRTTVPVLPRLAGEPLTGEDREIQQKLYEAMFAETDEEDEEGP